MKKVMPPLFCVLLIHLGGLVHAYDPQTHREIAERAAESQIASLDSVLKNELGLSRGINQAFPGLSIAGPRSIQELIGDGAFFEDDFRRFFNHFHNPLYQADGTGRGPWNQAGLRFGFQLGQSSVLWQQNTSQGSTFVFTPLPLPSGGGNWSWQDARRHYLNALTRARKEGIESEDGGNEAGRDAAFAEMFEALGRLTHLPQDATVPAHVRNDLHPRPLRNPDWYEDWVEGKRTSNRPEERLLFESLLNQNPVRPPFSIFTPTGDTQALVPIARLMDTDKFFGLNFSVLTDLDLGVTEYTNGNYLSRDTIFEDFDLPRQLGLAPNFIVEPVGVKFRRYRSKASEGEGVAHFVAEGMLHNSLQEALAGGPVPASGWTLDDKVNQDYAEKLLPRAVGYSASLLDYFFRGKLDVDLVINPENPSTVKLSGTYETTNGSTDSLVIGDLELYEDRSDGTRTPVPALDSTTITGVAPGGNIPSPTFQISEEAERFIAVYKGTLGNEVKDPANNFPGGVIGKVLGGVRVESIFPEGDKRMLRTVFGVFPLPASVDGLEKVQWGDEDNTFAGILSNPDTPRSPDQIVAFKINRPLGSTEVSLVDRPDGTQVVSADIIKAVSFPFGLSLGVTVNYSQTVQFRQLLLTFDDFSTYVWDGSDYKLTTREIKSPVDEIVVDESISFAQNFSIVLDREHVFVGGPTPSSRPYRWSVEEVAYDSKQRLLAIVRVNLTSPDDNVRTIPLLRYNAEGVLEEDPIRIVRIFGRYPAPTSLWALVDVEKGEVLGVTSSPVISLSSRLADSTTGLARHIKETFIGGPTPEVRERWTTAQSQQANPDYTTVETGTVQRPEEGTLSRTISGRFRADLETIIRAPFAISTDSTTSSLVYFVDDIAETNRSIKINNTFSDLTGIRTISLNAQWIKPSANMSDELLLLVRQQDIQPPGNQSTLLIRWSPRFPSDTALVKDFPLGQDYSLKRTTSEAAFIVFENEEDEDIRSTLIVDIATKRTHTFPDQNLHEEYALLDPKFLYNIVDTRFHTLDPSPRPTPLPRLLAAAPAILPPIAAYHAVRLR